MSRFIEDIADKLARDAIKAAEEHDSDKIVDEVANILGATSSTTQEHFLTFVRVHRASKRATEYLAGLKKPEG